MRQSAPPLRERELGGAVAVTLAALLGHDVSTLERRVAAET